MSYTQYSIVLVNLDPSVGSEMKKTRPCVVISPDEMNKYLGTIIIAPITNTSKPYPTRIEIKNSEVSGWIALDQIKVIDKQRVVKYLESLTGEMVLNIKSVIRQTYVD